MAVAKLSGRARASFESVQTARRLGRECERVSERRGLCCVCGPEKGNGNGAGNSCNSSGT